MKTAINNFWACFEKLNTGLISAYHLNDVKAMKGYINILSHKLREINNKWSYYICFESEYKYALIISLKGSKPYCNTAYLFVQSAPVVGNWTYKIGIDPYEIPNLPMKIHFPQSNLEVLSNQVYVHVHKIYKSSNKLHLHVYMGLNKKGMPKSEIKPLALDFLNLYLGDDYYSKHISRVKIVRRFLKNTNFIPLSELKHLIELKSLN